MRCTIFVDEADHLCRNRVLLDTIRDLHDETNIPVVLVGMDEIQKKLMRHHQFWSRVSQQVVYHPLQGREIMLRGFMRRIGKARSRNTAYELIREHKGAFQRLGDAELEELGEGIDSWWAVDSFARTLSGPAWLEGLVPDELIHNWAKSEDCWWRRAALVSTVALNVRSHGGQGDVPRTLAVCRLLVDDHDDMVVKALSWALRELVVHDAEAVRSFLEEYEERLAARVKREVRNKLTTGRKNPK